MTRKRGLIDESDWQPEKDSDHAAKQEDIPKREEIKEEVEEDFLQSFLREQREKRNPKPIMDDVEEMPGLKEKTCQTANVKEKSVYERAMEQLEDSEKTDEKSEKFVFKLSDRLKNMQVKTAPGIKKISDSVFTSAANIMKNNKQKDTVEKTLKKDASGDEQKHKHKQPVKSGKQKTETLGELKKEKKTGQTVPATKRNITGTSEIAFLGAEKGVGTTYAAFICAAALKHNYKVCVLELNRSGHFTEIFEYLNQEVPGKRKMFRYGGVDYYFNLSYRDFIAEFRPQYDFIITDNGAEPDISDYTQIQLADHVFVVARGDEWRLNSLKRVTEILSAKDRLHSWCYLITLKEVSRQIKKIIKYNHTVSLPYVEVPFEGNNKTSDLFCQALGCNE